MIDWAKAVLGIITLVRQFTTYMHDKRMIDTGRLTEIANALQTASDEISAARAASDEATARHQKDPTDEAFNKRFKRDD